MIIVKTCRHGEDAYVKMKKRSKEKTWTPKVSVLYDSSDKKLHPTNKGKKVLGRSQRWSYWWLISVSKRFFFFLPASICTWSTRGHFKSLQWNKQFPFNAFPVKREAPERIRSKNKGLDLLDKQTNSAKNTTVCGLICETVPVD